MTFLPGFICGIAVGAGAAIVVLGELLTRGRLIVNGAPPCLACASYEAGRCLKGNTSEMCGDFSCFRSKVQR